MCFPPAEAWRYHVGRPLCPRELGSRLFPRQLQHNVPLQTWQYKYLAQPLIHIYKQRYIISCIDGGSLPTACKTILRVHAITTVSGCLRKSTRGIIDRLVLYYPSRSKPVRRGRASPRFVASQVQKKPSLTGRFYPSPSVLADCSRLAQRKRGHEVDTGYSVHQGSSREPWST